MPRIQYIDLTKGVMMTLVILHHQHLDTGTHLDAMLAITRMPLYMMLCGLFFSTYGNSFKTLLVKKTNRYIVPYFFFIAVNIGALWIFHPYFDLNAAKSIIWDLLHEQYKPTLIGYLWFFRLLLNFSIICFVLERATTPLTRAQKTALTFVISFSAFLLHQYLYQHVDGYRDVYAYYSFVMLALVQLPIYYLPYLYRDRILHEHNAKRLLLALPAAALLLYLTATDVCDYEAFCHPCYLTLIIAELSGIYCVFVPCYLIKRLPYFSYIGRYSIIAYGTHIVLAKLLRDCLGISAPWPNTIAVFALTPIIIWLFIRIFPYFTAQKDIFKCHTGNSPKH